MPAATSLLHSPRVWMWFIILSTLTAGAVASLSAKTAYQVLTVGLCDDTKAVPFQKPYFLTMAMFIGEACCLAGFYLFVKPKLDSEAARTAAQLAAPLLDDGAPFPVPSSVSSTSLPSTMSRNGGGLMKEQLPPCPSWFFLALCSIDLTASTLNFVGLLWVSASLNQMFRGSMAVFVALFSLCLLRLRLSTEQWVAIVAVVFGLCTVGFSSYLQPTSSSTDSVAGPSTTLVFLGLLLILAGAALNSFQNVVEELLMKMLTQYKEPHPLEIVGWEGVYGTLLAGLVMLPAVYYMPGDDCGGRQENSLDTLYQLRNPTVLMLVVAYIAALGYMNYSSMELSRLLSAVVRNLVSAMRTVLVWVVSVLLYYAVGPTYGERLGLWSIVELCGFVLLIAGSMLYSRAKEKTAGAKKHSRGGKGKRQQQGSKHVQDSEEDEEEEEEEEDDDEVAVNGVHNRAPVIPV